MSDNQEGSKANTETCR